MSERHKRNRKLTWAAVWILSLVHDLQSQDKDLALFLTGPVPTVFSRYSHTVPLYGHAIKYPSGSLSPNIKDRKLDEEPQS